jgi:predicted transposase YdaD
MEDIIEVESPLVAGWLAEARAEGKIEGKAEGKIEGKAEGKMEGKAEGKVEAILRVLRKRFGELPERLTASVRACADVDRLDRGLDAALDAATLDQFLQQTGL